MLYNKSNKQTYKQLKFRLKFGLSSDIIIIIKYHNYYKIISILFFYFYTGLNTRLPSTISSVPINKGSTLGFFRAAVKLSLS